MPKRTLDITYESLYNSDSITLLLKNLKKRWRWVPYHELEHIGYMAVWDALTKHDSQQYPDGKIENSVWEYFKFRCKRYGSAKLKDLERSNQDDYLSLEFYDKQNRIDARIFINEIMSGGCLSETEKQLVHYRYLDGDTIAEISKKTNKPHETVRKRIKTAIEKVRERYNHE